MLLALRVFGASGGEVEGAEVVPECCWCAAAELPNAHVVSMVCGKPNASSLYFGDSFAHCSCYLSHDG